MQKHSKIFDAPFSRPFGVTGNDAQKLHARQLLPIFVVRRRRMKFYAYSSNLLVANGLSKPFADGMSTWDSRFSGARECSQLEARS